MIIKVKEFSSENIFCTRLMIVKLSVPVINTRVLRYVQLQWMCVESVCTPSLVTFSCYCYHRKTSNKHMLVNAKCYFLSVFFFYLKLCVIFPLQSDLLNMTMYDLVYEDDQSELYSAMLTPGNTVDTMHYSDTKGWSCVAGKIWFVAVIAVRFFLYLTSQYICHVYFC